MSKTVTIAIYILALVATVVIVDIIFFRQHIWERLLVNIGIVLIYIAFYLRFLKH